LSFKKIIYGLLFGWLEVLLMDYLCWECEELLSNHCDCGGHPITGPGICDNNLCDVFLDYEDKRLQLINKKRAALFNL